MMNTSSVVIAFLMVMPIGEIWVDAIGGSVLGDGVTPETAFKRINQGILAASPGDVIKVKKGVYDISLEEIFPLSIPSEVSLIGVDSGDDDEDFARIGGDLADEDFLDLSVKALVLIDGRSSARTDVVVENFIFLGQDEEDFDSPSAVMLVGNLSDCIVRNNICRRGEMNDAEQADRATIVLGGVAGSQITACSVEGNQVQPTRRAAIEMAPAGSGAVEQVGIVIRDNTIQNPAGTSTDYGIHWSGVEARLVGNASIRSNQIVSISQGIRDGIAIEITGGFGESSTSTFHVGEIVDNLVIGCSLDGVFLSADKSANLTLSPFARNVIRDNGGSGVHVVRDPTHDDEGSGYINVHHEGNVIVGNDRYGFEIAGLGETSGGHSPFINDTVADNALGAIGFLDWADAEDRISDTQMSGLYGQAMNCIWWDNNSIGGYEQVVGLDGGLLNFFISRTSYTIWDHLPGTPANDNLDSDPLFTDDPTGLYHIAGNSPCVDSGRVSVAVQAVVDIDLDDRILDGDHPICERPPVNAIDRGADEVPDPCD